MNLESFSSCEVLCWSLHASVAWTSILVQTHMYSLVLLDSSVIFINENENDEKRENNEFVNEN